MNVSGNPDQFGILSDRAKPGALMAINTSSAYLGSFVYKDVSISSHTLSIFLYHSVAVVFYYRSQSWFVSKRVLSAFIDISASKESVRRIGKHATKTLVRSKQLLWLYTIWLVQSFPTVMLGGD